MTTEKKNLESGAAGKPGESTAAKDKQITLTASGMAAYFREEVAAEPGEKQETPPAKEIPAAGESHEAPPGGDKIVELKPGDETPEQKAERERQAAAGQEAEAAATAASELAARAEANGVTVEEQQATEAAEAAKASLPEEVQKTLDAWEESGGPLPAPLQKLVDTRIGKEVAKTRAEKDRADAAEAQLRQVTAEAEALRNDPQRPAHMTPPTLLDERTVTKLAQQAQVMVADFENFLDGTATDEERTRVERFMASRHLDEKGLKRELRQTNTFLTQEVPELRKQVQAFQAQERTFAPAAQARFPWLADKASPDYARAQQVLGLMPELPQRTPAHQTAVGTYVLGLKVLDALNAAGHEGDAVAALAPVLAKAFPPKNGKPAAKPAAAQPPPRPPAGGAGPGRAKVSPSEAASQKFNKAPTRQNATELARAALAEA